MSTASLDRPINFARRVVRGLARRLRNLARSTYRLITRRTLKENVVALRSDVAALHVVIRQLRTEFAGQMSFFSHDASEQISDLATKSGSKLSQLETSLTDARNRLIHLDTSLHSRFNDVLNVQFPGILEQFHEVTALQLKVADHSTTESDSVTSPRPSAINIRPFDFVLAQAQRDFPTVFAAWKERLEDTREAIDATDVGNVANAADAYSSLFRAFVELHVQGAVLDVGCGPVGKPFYLDSYPSFLVSGIDPLLKDQPSTIEAVRGISEYLPWPDQSFSTVISATSLDHCVSLDRSIEEIIRVLKPNGKVLLWIGSNPGSPPYRPLDPEFVPADRYHLFHFDIVWFEPMLEEHFRIIDRVKLDRAGYSHVFYCLGLRQ